VQLPDDCGIGTGNFYFYDATTGKWDVKTVGITSFKAATSYWFYSTKYCPVTVTASGEVAASHITLSKGEEGDAEWNYVGAPKGGLPSAVTAMTHDIVCRNCGAGGMAGTCSSVVVKYYNTTESQFKDATSLQEGVGYMVQCIGS
jgi:hypothetical protein